MSYTKPQLQAISSRSRQTLVSAAAGSGKTHVLTRRIEALVRGADLDNFAEDDGTQVNLDKMEDIRRMLVMTFTRAAAAEMRGRIVDTLTKASQVQTDQGNDVAAVALRRQAEAAAGADISTVHSFCSRVIGENYELAGVCAGFSILSDDQSTQLMQTAAREIFDERYERDDEEIVRLLRRFTAKGRDEQLIEIVLRIYRQMMGTDDWEAWLDLPFAPDWNKQMMEGWNRVRLEELEHAVEAEQQAERLTRYAAEHTDDPAEQKAILKKADSDVKQLQKLSKLLAAAREQGVDAAAATLGRTAFPNTKGMPGMLATAYELREEAKKALKVFQSSGYDSVDMEEALAESHEDLRILTDIVREFTARYDQKKRALNKVDYSDLEHKALQVLRALREQGKGYDQHYRHVFVDEYQDTNQVQESILRELTGENHVFMVGDLKQSIYGFRFADPTIFKSKDDAFAKSDDAALQQCIHMNHNFRSSPAVIGTVNEVMHCLMKESMGGVAYEEGEELIYQRSIALGDAEDEPGHTQILIADAEAGPLTEDGNPSDEMEAEMIASRIAELNAQGKKFGDMAVLMRSRSERVSALEAAFEARGIPYAAILDANRTFTELDVFLNFLELIVNERRDVPLLSVMRSYMFGFDEADFARIVNWSELNPDWKKKDAAGGKRRGQAFFSRLSRFRDAAKGGKLTDPEDKDLAKRVEDFFTELGKVRTMGTDMSLVRFAEEIGARYDFSSYLLTRPAGGSRKKAFDALLQTIAAQQEIHGNSLYRVLQAVRKVRQGDDPDTGDVAGSVDAVRIMTIHKSKGLEIPIVFLAAMDREFNTKSASGDFLMTDKYGVTVKSVDEKKHAKRDTVETSIVKRYIGEQQMSEELRMLYVAMTRAKDQLYLCGAAKDEEKCESRWRSLNGRHAQAKSMLDWVMSAYYELTEEGEQPPKTLYNGSFWKHGETVGPKNEAGSATEDEQDVVAFVDEALAGAKSDFFGLDARKRVAAAQGVSKRIAADRRDVEEEGGIRAPYAAAAVRPALRPATGGSGSIRGAERGTLLHRALQFAVRTRTAPEQAVPEMVRRQLITREEEAELMRSMDALNAFFESPLYERARKSPRMLIEQPFELLMAPPEDAEYSGERMRLRGKIDLAFIEDDGWVLVDYKSDRGADGQQLAERYAPQIGYYREALERISGKPVRESYLFSLENKEAVPV